MPHPWGLLAGDGIVAKNHLHKGGPSCLCRLYFGLCGDLRTIRPWARYVHDPDARGIGTVRYLRTVPKDEECAKELAKRTLTNLYNARPAWLDLTHQKLDAAVFAAYGWDAGMSDEEILAKLLELNLQATPRSSVNHSD